MLCKILEHDDIIFFKNFKDDENTIYNIEKLKQFIEEKNCYGFIIKDEDSVFGFAYGYLHLRPDGNKDFYLHSIDIMKEYQNNGYGKKLLSYIKEFIQKLGCKKMFLITNKSNLSACSCYEKVGGIAKSKDDVVYSYNIIDKGI